MSKAGADSTAHSPVDFLPDTSTPSDQRKDGSRRSSSRPGSKCLNRHREGRHEKTHNEKSPTADRP